ncbi:MAG: hypothetical protein LBN21_11095 [Treponema sp.]|jgi:hypothetical protein|nr:hypothetical protein [Treponema sp.]
MQTFEWLRLDTAAKLFPSTTTKQESMVFRLVCELNETVDPIILQRALDVSLESFPFYRSVLRHGLFWYYLEKTNLTPEVHEEFSTPCAHLYNENRASLLFSLTYYRRRINIEIYHVLADAVGASNFFRTIIYQYLMEKHKTELAENIRLSFDDAPIDQKIDNAFDTYYSKGKAAKQAKAVRAYRMRGERFSQSRFGIIEAHVSTEALLKKAHELNATLSELLVSLLIFSFKDTLRQIDEKHPVDIKVPVDFRNFFSSTTKRNFLGVFDVSYNFGGQGKTFKDVLENVQRIFKSELTQEKMIEQINWYSSFEQAPLLKIIPLVIKNLALKNVSSTEKKRSSATFSNLGAIKMPKEFSQYIRLFSIFCSVKDLYVGVCSFQDITTISFTSPFIKMSIQRSFCRELSSFGIDVEIAANIQDLEPEGL